MIGPGTRSILANSMFLFGGQGVTLAVRVVYSVALAVLLGPALFGYYNYGLAWYILLMPFTALGLQMILSREIGADRNCASALLPQTLLIRGGAAVLTALAMAVVAWWFEPEPQLRSLLLIMSVALVARAISLWATLVFVAYEESWLSFQQDSVFRTLEVVIGIGVALATLDVLAVATVHALSWLAQATRGLWLVHARYGPLQFNMALLRGSSSIVRLGIPIGIVGVVSGWFLQGPVVLARYFVENPEQMGQVVTAIQMLGYVGMVPQMVAVAAVPVLSRSAIRGDRKDALFVSLAIRAAIVVGGLAALAGAAFGEPVVLALLGERYRDASVLVGGILWAAIPLACSAIATQSLMTRRAVGSTLWASAATGVVFTGLIAHAFMTRPLSEVTWAILAGLTLWATALCLLLARLKLLRLGSDFLRPVAVVAAAAALFAGTSFLWSGWRFLLASALLSLGALLLVVPEEVRRIAHRLRPKY